MKVIGYGEDGLTYRGLTQELPDVLAALEGPEHSKPAECLLFFRPSFGRAGGFRSSQFGEFDAILATERAVYLIETKWDGSSSLGRDAVVLDFRQVLRHQIFEWMRKAWMEPCPPDWATFANDNQVPFALAFQDKPMAPEGSRLANNLGYILKKLSDFASKTKHVLLYFHREGQAIPATVQAVGIPGLPIQFEIIPRVYHPLNPGGYFEISPLA